MDRRRRLLLLGAARVAALGAIGAAQLGAYAFAREPSPTYPFCLGVASGAPLPDSVILWTRILSDPLAADAGALALAVRWEVAEDEAFARVVAKGVAFAVPALAHSVHVDVTGLSPARWYWYRFLQGDAISPVGRTRTAPAAGSMPTQLKLAVASCQHWEFGEFGAHRHIAAAAPDLVAFLGDYIYEWGPYSLTHPAAVRSGDECMTLAHYRARYAQYKSDPQLQAAHQVAPWLVTWDDHEVANDYASDRDERLSADFLQRRTCAYQAFYEHMPVRLSAPRPGAFGAMRIYQRTDWGQLARFHLLDARQYRSHHACQPSGRGGSSSTTIAACRQLLDPSRSMLGPDQESWLAQGLNTSRARWNIIAQQTLMARNSQLPVQAPEDGRYWTDGWDGYPMARQRLLDAVRDSRAANPLVLSGDVHTFYTAHLRRDMLRPESASNPVVASELCASSVTSSSRPQARTDQYLAHNPHITFGRSDKRGCMLLTITPERTSAVFLGLADVQDAQSPITPLATFNIADGNRHLDPA